MVADCQTIRAEDYRRCGTEIGRIGPMLLADRYHHCTHFNFELLEKWKTPSPTGRRQGSLSVQFDPHQTGPPRWPLRSDIGIEPRAQRRHVAREIGRRRALLDHTLWI